MKACGKEHSDCGKPDEFTTPRAILIFYDKITELSPTCCEMVWFSFSRMGTVGKKNVGWMRGNAATDPRATGNAGPAQCALCSARQKDREKQSRDACQAAMSHQNSSVGRTMPSPSGRP